MQGQPDTIAISFAEKGEADRRIAGVAAAARCVRQLATGGVSTVKLSVPGASLKRSTLADLTRLCPGVSVEICDRPLPGALPAPKMSSREVLRATAKPSDGPVSRWLNRPVSRPISALLLLIPGVRPLHASIGTMVLAAAMFAWLLFGGANGLIAGGLLFHAASVFDGVDGEIARATFRTSRLGALLDSVIDMATNGLFILGVTVNLAANNPWAAPIGIWGLVLFLLGLATIRVTTPRQDRPFSMEVVKERYRARWGPASAGLIRFLTAVSSRDFFALLFALLILAGRPMAILYIFALAATIWIWFVMGAAAGSLSDSSIEKNA